MMKFEKKHEDWIYDEFKTQSGIGIKEIRYGIEPGRRAAIVRLEDGRAYRFDLYERNGYQDWFEARKHHDNISWKKEPIVNQYPVSRRGITDMRLAQSICVYMRYLDEEEREAEEKC